jgi:hypothetical protein
MERGAVSWAWGLFFCCASGCSSASGSPGASSTRSDVDPSEERAEPDASASEPGDDASVVPMPPPPMPPPEPPPEPPPDEGDFVSTLPPLEPGQPIEVEPHTWTWVPVPEARCQGDDATGMYFNLGDPEKLVILMEGGGACYNAFTCALSLAIHPLGASALDTPAISAAYGNNLFNRDDPQNPVRDYSYVFFPYCSGDVFAGASSSASGYEGRTQQGYYNVRAYLRRLIATFPTAEKVVLTGVSAGGFGAGFNFDQVQEAFGQHTRVYLVDDSGPPMLPEQMTPCLQERWREAWSLDDIMPPESACPGCRNPRSDVGVAGMLEYLATKYPSRRLAVISAVHDGVIRQFFGFGLDDCRGLDPPLNLPLAGPSVSPEAYEAGLKALLAYAESIPNGATMRGFLVPDSEMHTFLVAPGAFANTVVDGISLGEWLRQLVEDDPAWDHAGVH